MLRRRLLIMLALLTAMMLATALSAVFLMRGVLKDLEHINSLAMIGTTASTGLGESVGVIESELLMWARTSEVNVELLLSSVDSMGDHIEQLRSYYSIESDGFDSFTRLEHGWSDLNRGVDRLAGSSPEYAPDDIESALQSAHQVRQAIVAHADYSFKHMKMEQAQVTMRFRWMAMSLAAIFVVLINVSIILLIRAASWVLKPVERLIEASRHLAREEYDFRVEVGRKDEFDELASGFNHLAEHMQENEHRKIEMLHQVARTLNHELNNAIAIIELQLRMVTKSPGYDHASSEQLEMIHETLHKMNQTVTSLTQVRRVVLTDYIKGVKMLDLKRSMQPKGSPEPDPEQSQRVIIP